MAKSRKVSVPVHEQELWDEPEIAAVASAQHHDRAAMGAQGAHSKSLAAVRSASVRTSIGRLLTGFLAGLESEPVVEG